MNKRPQPGETYMYKSHIPYKVLFLTNTANENPDYPIQVVYQGSNGNIWSRPLETWFDSMTLGIAHLNKDNHG